MKIVREHINEKFTEDSDPIHDMGIGMDILLNEFFKKLGISVDDMPNEKILRICIYHDRYDLADYLISKGLNIYGSIDNYGYLLGNAVYDNNWKLGKYLIRKGVDLDKTIEKSIKKDLTITVENLLRLKEEIEKDSLT